MRSCVLIAILWVLLPQGVGDAEADTTLADHVRAQRDTEALAFIADIERKSKLEPALRYLKGRLLERTGKICQAANAYDLPNATFPADVQTDVQRRWARASARCGRCEQAVAPLTALADKGGREAAQDRAWIARCEFMSGNFDEAARQYQALLKRRVPGLDKVDATLNLASALTKLGETDEAKRVLERATISLAAHRRISKVRAALLEMGGQVPQTESDRLRRSEVLYKARKYEEALGELENQPVPKDDATRTKWLHLQGMALFRMRTRYEEAAKVLAKAAASAGKRGVGDEFLAARALSRAGQDRRAIAEYRKFVRKYPRHRDAAEAEFLAGWLEIRLGLRKGEIALERMLRGPRGRSGKWRRKALWELAFRAIEKRQYTRARKFLVRYSKEKLDRMEQAQAAYWLARTYQGSRKWGLAVKAYRQAITTVPLHWYASLAAHRLQRMKRKVGAPFPEDDSVRDAREPFHIEWPAAVTFYSRLGLVDDSVAALRRHRADVVKGVSSSEETRFFVQAYSELGAHREAYRLAMKQPGTLMKEPTSQTMWWWSAAYPTPWHDAVKKWAKRQRVEEAHVYGSMRQESAYNPAAVSPAGAVGLLQLMPKVADRLAKKAGVKVDRQQLFDPDWNIRLGVMEMRERHREFGGVMPLTIAGYNAGSRRVREWMKRSGRMELDRFVERIPFNETKNYVRRVMSHYARYRYLQDPKRGWPVPLPRRFVLLVDGWLDTGRSASEAAALVFGTRMNFIAAGLTDVGLHREHNEDSYCILSEHRLFVVADGMGGHRAGDIASRMATFAISKFFASFAESRAIWPFSYDERLSVAENRLLTGVKIANQRIFEASVRHLEVQGMGTTVVSALFDKDEQRMYIAHVGDSRAYRIRGGHIELLTMDHSLVNDYLVVMPHLTDAQKKELPSNVITRALGMQQSVTVDMQRDEVQVGDIYVLCSDGLNGMITDEDIRAIVELEDEDVETASLRLVDSAKENGGEDNITVVVIRITE